MEIRFCAECGTERLPAAGFCGTCGNAFAGITAPAGTGAAPQSEVEAPWEPTPAPPPESVWGAEPLSSFDIESPTEPLPPPISWVPVAEPASLPPPPVPVARRARRSRTGRRRVGIMLAISGAAVVVAAVAIAFLVLRREPAAVTAALGSPTPGPAATRPPTPMPATPIPSAGPTPEPALSTFSAFEVDSLRQLLPSRLAPSCNAVSWWPADPADAAKVLASVQCQGGGGERTVLYTRVADPGSMTSGYEAWIAAQGIPRDSGGCWDGGVGEVSWTHGRAVCYLDAAGSPAVVWTDERLSVSGHATAPTGSLQDLVDWWWNAALLPAESSGSDLTVDQQWLRDQVPASFDCRGYDAVKDAEDHPKRKVVDPVGDVGAIDCVPGARGVSDIGWFRFTTPAALDAWYLRRVALAGVAFDSGGCFDGNEGETSWEHGRVMCYRQDGSGTAKIRWINYDTMTYGALNATNSKLPALFAWWRENGMP